MCIYIYIHIHIDIYRDIYRVVLQLPLGSLGAFPPEMSASHRTASEKVRPNREQPMGVHLKGRLLFPSPRHSPGEPSLTTSRLPLREPHGKMKVAKGIGENGHGTTAKRTNMNQPILDMGVSFSRGR